MNVFTKISRIRKLLQPHLPGAEEGELIGLIRQAAKFHYDRKKMLSKDGAKVYEVFVKNGLNPYTVYRWFLLTKAPQGTKDKLRTQEISIRNAFKEKTEFKELLSTTERDMIHEVLNCVERFIVR